MESEQNVQNKVSCEWETSWKTNTLQAYVSTVWRVITEPTNYFSQIKPFKDLFSLAVFIYINSVISITLSMGLQMMFRVVTSETDVFFMGLTEMACGVLFGPFVVTAIAFLIGAVLHLFYSLIGGSEKNYNTTMTVYGLGSACALFGIIPVLGNAVSFVYVLLINIGGQSKAHDISFGRAAVSVLLPAFVCCCIFVTFGIVAGAFISSLAAFFNHV